MPSPTAKSKAETSWPSLCIASAIFVIVSLGGFLLRLTDDDKTQDTVVLLSPVSAMICEISP